MRSGTGIFVLRDETSLVAMQPASFATEDDFQRLLASFPELLAGDQINAQDPRRFLLVAREKGIASEEGGGDRWSLDHLFLDQDGVPTLVEVKRGTDTRIRREVVGQMLDYAANSVLYWPVEELRAQWRESCDREGRDPESVMAEFLGVAADTEGFWTTVRTNLQAGRIRLLFVADKIPSELRRIVEFLNRQMQPAEVLALELRQYEGQGLKTLAPIVFGRTEEAAQRKGASRPPTEIRSWNEDAVLAAIAERDDRELLETSRKIVDWIKANADEVVFGTNAKWGSIGAQFIRGDTSILALRLWTDGTAVVYFQHMIGKPVFGDLARREELLDRLNAISGIKLPADAVSKRKTIQLSGWTSETTAGFLSAMDWFAGTLRASPANPAAASRKA